MFRNNSRSDAEMFQRSTKTTLAVLFFMVCVSSAYAWNDYAESNSTISGRQELITYGNKTYGETDFWLADYDSGSINGTDFNLILDNAAIMTKQDFKGKQFKINATSNLTISLCDIPDYEIWCKR